MTIRILVLLIALLAVTPGCRTWSWGWKQEKQEDHMVDNFTDSSGAGTEDEDEDFTDGASFAKKNGRTQDPGTGLSDRSREIERNLGYR
ncbi:hypothetical protein ACYFX5_20770 [Bremerella sp. T1]|uniref:hypothetical protein n=1 Tax=Bremerella sp. TYQ1 TaxID=3119568 RepID=UPI001CCB1691|nr:hypothetical protein [Bremerella volcania]UBM35477.1 hypothetical protein LA756_22710 [Bremerella volcania]